MYKLVYEINVIIKYTEEKVHCTKASIGDMSQNLSTYFSVSPQATRFNISTE